MPGLANNEGKLVEAVPSKAASPMTEKDAFVADWVDPYWQPAFFVVLVMLLIVAVRWRR